uniref:tRNA-queuosine alpha-mannosyltransferase n=1 Tax=Eptatretus burgeri TaxID=7764 RepID=A0A8C4QT45_EPTBU
MSILLIEPFCGGSHRQLVDLLVSEFGNNCVLHSLPAKKWHWRARTSALCFSQSIPKSEHYRVLFTSSVLNLAELLALRPDLAALHKVLYFHENQLVYPVRHAHERDFQYGYNQVLSCLVADVIAFNSHYNMESFLSSIYSFMKQIPDFIPKDLSEAVRPKCHVLHFPIVFPVLSSFLPDVLHMQANTKDDEDILAQEQEPEGDLMVSKDLRSCCLRPAEPIGSSQDALHIVWPHRWEHDKDPEAFFSCIFALKQNGLSFRLSVIGESYSEVPDVFVEAKRVLHLEIAHWGYQAARMDYYDVLRSADVVVSTARHEFFGVAMLEAVHCGCYPLCPKALVYPEIFPGECSFQAQCDDLPTCTSCTAHHTGISQVL